jgi:hypothetical protein
MKTVREKRLYMAGEVNTPSTTIRAVKPGI